MRARVHPDKLRAARQVRDFSQLDLALAADITPETVSRIENGAQTTGKTARAIAAALRVDWHDLLSDDDGFNLSKSINKGEI